MHTRSVVDYWMATKRSGVDVNDRDVLHVAHVI
jgi:hypothetical protein